MLLLIAAAAFDAAAPKLRASVLEPNLKRIKSKEICGVICNMRVWKNLSPLQ